MLAALPLLAYAALFLVVRRFLPSRCESAIYSAAGWCLAMLVLTETLSRFQLIRTVPLAIGWALVAGLSLGLLFQLRRRPRPATPPRDPADPAMVLLLTAAAICLAVTGLLSLTPPNTVDVVAYHLPRAAMWLQHQSVDHYATSTLRQLFMPPLAEFIQLHFMALFGSDLLSGASHWFAFLLTGLAAAAVAARLGATPPAQALAAFLVYLLPQGLLTASGAKNDWTVTLWILATFLFLLRYLETPASVNALLTGLCAALAVLTKATALVILPGLAAVILFRRPPVTIRRLALHAAAATAIFGVLVAPATWRNKRDLGAILFMPPGASDMHHALGNSRFSPSTLYSNLVRNLALHAATPNKEWNKSVQVTAERALTAFGIDPSDPLTTFGGMKFAVTELRFYETTAPNTLHVLMMFGALAATLLLARLRAAPEIRAAMLAPLLAALLFCIALRWQPWHTRLHLPLFVMAAPWLALVLSRLRPGVTIPVAAALLLVTSSPALFLNELRSVTGPYSVFALTREERLFLDRLHHLKAFSDAAHAARDSGCRQVGFDSSIYQYDYPFFSILGVPRGESRLRYVGVKGVAAALESRFDPFEPCAIICLGCAFEPPRIETHRARLPRVLTFEHVVVFLPEQPR